MPGYWLDPLDVRALDDGKNWLLLRELRYVTASGDVITIHAGFVTDFASIPWVFRRLFQPATGKHRRAAVVHDWVYRTAGVDMTRKECDDLFNEIMEVDQTQGWKRRALYRGVRVGGKSSFVPREEFKVGD